MGKKHKQTFSGFPPEIGYLLGSARALKSPKARPGPRSDFYLTKKYSLKKKVAKLRKNWPQVLKKCDSFL